MSSSRTHILASAIAIACLAASASAAAHGSAASAVTVAPGHVPAALAVRKELPPPASGVADLKFRELFTLPVGPRGLEPSERLRALDGKRVRMVGFMVRSPEPGNASFVLAPMPVEISDEDEAQADDIPPSAVLVRLPKAQTMPIPNLAGLIRIEGVLRLGNVEDVTTQRVFSVLVELDAKPARALSKFSTDVVRRKASPRPAAP